MNIINTTIGELCDVGDGTHAKIQRKDSGIKYLSSKNFKGNGLDLSKLDYISEEDFKKHFRADSKALTKPQTNDILMSIIGTMGMPYVVKENDLFGLSSSVCIIRPMNEIFPQYLYYWMLTPEFQQAVINFKSGVAQGFLSLDTIRKLPLLYPEIDIQKKIVDIISKYDNLIENSFKRIKLLEETADMIYKEWFVNFRFPGYEKCEFIDGIPINWFKGVVNNAIEFNIGGGWGQEEKSGDFIESAYVIRGTDIPNLSIGDFNNVPYRYHKESNLLNRKLLMGDIIFEASGGSKGQSIGRTLYINNAILDVFNDNVMCASFCKLIRSKNIELSYYLLGFIKNARMNGTLALYESQSASNIINFRFTDFLDKQEFTIPDKKVLDQFRNVIEPITNKLVLLSLQINKLKEARDILIPKLIMGEIEV